MGLK
jgi:hypothetical protein